MIKVAVVNVITNDVVKKLILHDIKIVIYNRLGKEVDYDEVKNKFKLIDVYADFTNANWYGYNKVENKLMLLKQKFPNLFVYKNYDLTSALVKDIYWAFFDDNVLDFNAEKFVKPDYKLIYLNKRGGLKKRMALFKRLFLQKVEKELFPDGSNDSNKNKIAFRINDTSVINKYGRLFKRLGRDNIVSFQSKQGGVKQVDLIESNSFFSSNYSLIEATEYLSIDSISCKIKLLLSPDCDFVNVFFHCLNNLRNKVEVYEGLFHKGIRKVVLNAGENEGEGIIASLVANKLGGKTFNYMNGAKAKDPHNMNTMFNYWFMHDQKTKDLILSYCDVKKEQLPVTGHLLYEDIASHTYSGTLDEFNEIMSGKKIISLFTSKLFAAEKNSVLSFFKKYLDERKDVLVLIRHHPSEKRDEKFIHERIVALPTSKKELSEKSLFDLISKSDLVISFASTVSLQASWFKKPSLNYEEAEISRLPYVDDEFVFHIKDVEMLKSEIEGYLYGGKKMPTFIMQNNAVENIAEILEQ